jgi:hypothetical protein
MAHVTQGMQVPACHTTQSNILSDHNAQIFIFVSVLHIRTQLIDSIFRNLHLVQGAEDGGSKLLLVIHSFGSYFTCLQVRENTITIDHAWCSRGYVQSQDMGHAVKIMYNEIFKCQQQHKM